MTEQPKFDIAHAEGSAKSNRLTYTDMLLAYYYLQLAGFLAFPMTVLCTRERQLESDFFGSLNSCVSSLHK